MPTANEIRQQFIDFFVEKHQHVVVPSSSVVPHGDPTLLFANAGMNQFKPYFLGTEKPTHTRVANSQKCIRAGGKHNDLDDVGKDTYHHTFFEMLGNWSFGDYFKKEAITWAWELLTQVWKIDPKRLHVTIFEGDDIVPRDDEAQAIWQSVGVADDHIHLGNAKDNFWEMGNTGPCGPCTEVHYDATPDFSGGPLVNGDSDKVIEIWNLVFIQYNRNEDRSLTPLPAKHVDTGMGLERIVKVLQGKGSNYDTDLFQPIFETIQQVTDAPPYGGSMTEPRDIAYRVIADHCRMLSFAIADGAVPSNTGQGSVVRSVLRRASVFGWLNFQMREPFLYSIAPKVVATFRGFFPELARAEDKIIHVIRSEEESFLKTIAKGLKLFDDASTSAQETGQPISGKDAFDLHTEQGFSIDMTEKLAADKGLTVDRKEYDRLFEEFQKQSGAGQKQNIVAAIQGELPLTDDRDKFHHLRGKATILGWVRENEVVTDGVLDEKQNVALLVDRTIFYAEQGGQVGDTGTFTSELGGKFEVVHTQRLGNSVLHLGTMLSGNFKVGDEVTLSVALSARRDIMRNHTATHLLNLALRQLLGDGVEQRGSLVDAQKTRFDFSHDKPLSVGQIREIESLVNDWINNDEPVTALTLPLESARQIPGVRAMFGEKYPDPVRVVMIGPTDPTEATVKDSIEFCGGTHLPFTGSIGIFKILSQEGVSKGVRRITAVTGNVATKTIQHESAILSELSELLNAPSSELPKRVTKLQADCKTLEKKLKQGVATDLTATIDSITANAETIHGSKLIVAELPEASVEQVRTQIDRLRQKLDSALIILIWSEGEKVPVIVALTRDLVEKGVKAGTIIKPIAESLGGKGGGKPDLAQAGGKDVAAMPKALQLARESGRTILNELS